MAEKKKLAWNKLVLILGLGALALVMVVGSSMARGYHNSVAAERLRAEGERLEAEAEKWRGRADSYKAEAEFWQGRASAYQTEAEKWRGVAVSLAALTEPLAAAVAVILAIAVLILAVGGAVGLSRIGWGFGRGSEAQMHARAQMIRPEPASREKDTVPSEYQAPPDSAVRSRLEDLGYGVGGSDG